MGDARSEASDGPGCRVYIQGYLVHKKRGTHISDDTGLPRSWGWKSQGTGGLRWPGLPGVPGKTSVSFNTHLFFAKLLAPSSILSLAIPAGDARPPAGDVFSTGVPRA